MHSAPAVLEVVATKVFIAAFSKVGRNYLEDSVGSASCTLIQGKPIKCDAREREIFFLSLLSDRTSPSGFGRPNSTIRGWRPYSSK